MKLDLKQTTILMGMCSALGMYDQRYKLAMEKQIL